ncbi:MAG: S46 family peptidase [Chlamydiota bacterium]
MIKKSLLTSICIAAYALAPAQEGMWPFNAIPVEQIQKEHGVTLSPEWVEHLQKSCLRVSLGGSASFVSSKGLVLTNHHVGSKAIYNLSTEDNNLIEHGFLAKTLDEELKCPNMYVDKLVSIQDVTEQVLEGTSDALSPQDREAMRKASIAKITKEAKDTSNLQPQVVSLYQGARYYLYLYERYTDIRLVMAPEKAIAFFGGDKDNFEYPRYDLDMCFFRVYQDNKPLEVTNYLKWSKKAPTESDLLFVAGHPGKTDRMLTSAHIQFLKEIDFPLLLSMLEEKHKHFETFAKESLENKRIVAQDLFSVENSLKVLKAFTKGLKEEPIIENKAKKESLLQTSIGNEPWVRLEETLKDAKDYYKTYLLLERASNAYSKLFNIAKHLVRLSDEKIKPNPEKLKEYLDAELPTLELTLLSKEPIYKNLEKAHLTATFTWLIQSLGVTHPVTTLILQNRSLEEAVDFLVNSTSLHNLGYREHLYNNLDKLHECSDPFILLVKALDPYMREIRKLKEERFDSITNDCYTQITHILFNTFGESIYPDATFTLRLSIGSMKGYKEGSTTISPTTTLYDIFDYAKSHSGEESYALPQSWLDKASLLNKNTPFNFISTHDIIGGNSGSPVINTQGELVGLIFDGNTHSLLWDFAFDDAQGRAVSVHASGILESLKTIYKAENLVKEVTN